MLNQFVLRNYRLFKNETLLDFFPAPINEHKASLLTAQGDGESFLPVISLYGPNGCGKSMSPLDFRRNIICTRFATTM